MKISLVFFLSIMCTLLYAQSSFRSEDYEHIRWEKPGNVPVIKPPFYSPVIADPTFITPDSSTDGRWHLFAHSILGILHYTSADGTRWKHTGHILVKQGIRAFIIKEQGRYYLFYEKVDNLIPYTSHIEMKSSRDLHSWSKAIKIFHADLPYAHEGGSGGSVGNPCIVKAGSIYRLYFSTGLVYLKDCGFSEPRYICYATAQAIDGPYVWAGKPVLAPDSTDPYRNAGAGAMKVIKTTDGYVGYENGIALLKNNHSYSSITLLRSKDGITWSKTSAEPFLKPTIGWQCDYVYALDIKFYQGKFYLYYNARRGHSWAVGRESIGLITGELK